MLQGVTLEATNDMIVYKPVIRTRKRVRTGVKCTLYSLSKINVIIYINNRLTDFIFFPSI